MSKRNNRRRQEAERKYKGSGEWPRAYKAKGRKTVLKRKGEPKAMVRGQGQRETENTRVTKKGKQRKGTEAKGKMLHGTVL